MSWGLPPKYNLEHKFKDTTHETINDSVINALLNTDFKIIHNASFTIEAEKKLKITFLSFFSWSRPRINLVILITRTGRLTINSKYDYNSMFGIAMNDAGKQKKELSLLLEEMKYIVKRNIEFEKYGTVDGISV